VEELLELRHRSEVGAHCTGDPQLFDHHAAAVARGPHFRAPPHSHLVDVSPPLVSSFGFLCTTTGFGLSRDRCHSTHASAGRLRLRAVVALDTVPDNTCVSFVLGVRLADASFGRAIRRASESKARCRSAPVGRPSCDLAHILEQCLCFCLSGKVRDLPAARSKPYGSVELMLKSGLLFDLLCFFDVSGNV